MEGGQMSKEQYEAQDDDDGEVEEAGHFSRASDAELATRKRFTLKKRDSNGASSTPSISAGGANPFASAFASSSTPSTNPFAGTLLTAPSTTAVKPAASNPFANTQLTAPPSVSLPSFSSLPSSASNVPATGAKPIIVGDNINSNDNEYKKKMRKLNESFLRWAERQVKENAVAIWKDGVKDYLKHQEALRTKFGSSDVPVTSTTSTKELTSSGTNSFSMPTANASATSEKSAFSLGASSATSVAASTSTSKVPPSTFSLGSSSGADSATTSNSSTAPKPFTFGAPLANSTPATAPAPFSFSLPNSSAAAPPASGGFNFSLPASNTSTGNAFAFKPPAPPAASLSTKTGGDDAEEGGDEEGEPILAPEKVLRNDQDTDIITLEVPCKLFYYNTTDKEWKDTGKGNLRITQDPTTKKKRMVMRNGTGKIILNAGFFKTFKVEKVKGGLKFSAFVANDTTGEAQFKMFMTKLKDENSEKLKAEIEKAVSELQ